MHFWLLKWAASFRRGELNLSGQRERYLEAGKSYVLEVEGRGGSSAPDFRLLCGASAIALFDFKTKSRRLSRGKNPRSAWLNRRHRREGVERYGQLYRGTVGFYRDYRNIGRFTVVG